MKPIYFFLLGLLLVACTQKEAPVERDQNPAADGFNATGSDPAAIELADSIMHAMGGRKAWDNIRYISWSTAGRSIIYDKQTERVRIVQGDTVYLLSATGTGRVQIKGNEVVESGALNPLLESIQTNWRLDLHNFLLPFILKGNGVTIRYMGEDSLSGQRFNSLILTFQQSADQYKLYVDKHAKLVRYGAYYQNAGDERETFIRPWDNYQKKENILLSADRTDGMGPRNVKIDKDLPEALFTEF